MESCVRGTTSTKLNLWDASVKKGTGMYSGKEKDPYAVAVMRRSTIVSHVPRKISAACWQFQADQRQRYYRIAGKFGGGFNLAIWRCRKKSPN